MGIDNQKDIRTIVMEKLRPAFDAYFLEVDGQDEDFEEVVSLDKKVLIDGLEKAICEFSREEVYELLKNVSSILGEVSDVNDPEDVMEYVNNTCRICVRRLVVLDDARELSGDPEVEKVRAQMRADYASGNWAS